MPFKSNILTLTGSIWHLSSRARAQAVRRVCEMLESTYGTPRLGNPKKPLDDLIYVLLSNKTPPERAQVAFRHLKRRFPKWSQIATADTQDIISILKPTGFAVKRTGQIQSILHKLKSDFGEYSLNALRAETEQDVQNYLTALPGVSDKVARCVMMYTMGFEVLPVDTHVHRVAYRLGWTAKTRPEQCHDELEKLIPPKRRYAFHVDCVAHGRTLCRSTRPKCNLCPLKAYCGYYNQFFARDREFQ